MEFLKTVSFCLLPNSFILHIIFYSVHIIMLNLQIQKQLLQIYCKTLTSYLEKAYLFPLDVIYFPSDTYNTNLDNNSIAGLRGTSGFSNTIQKFIKYVYLFCKKLLRDFCPFMAYFYSIVFALNRLVVVVCQFII